MKITPAKAEYAGRIEEVFKDHVYNIGRSSELCGRYIIRSLNSRRKR